MRHILAIVPQDIPYPEHQVPSCLSTSASCRRVVAGPILDARPCLQQLAEEAAFTPYGTSTAAAIVACCLFFVALCCAIANYVYTKYPFYDVLIISTACESLIFGTASARTSLCRSDLVFEQTIVQQSLTQAL